MKKRIPALVHLLNDTEKNQIGIIKAKKKIQTLALFIFQFEGVCQCAENQNQTLALSIFQFEGVCQCDA